MTAPRRGAPGGYGHHKGGTGASASRGRPEGRTTPPPAKPAIVWSQAQWQEAVRPVLAALGLDLNEAQQVLLSQYMAMLAHWNSTYNLTALRDAPDMLTHHLTDCLVVLGPLGRHVASRSPAAPGVRILDVGSGGGLPGVILAIARPDVQVTCVDTVGKKAAFIRQVAAELKLPNLKAEHARVEQLKGQYDLITSRAFASLDDFVNLTSALLAPAGVWMAMKGKTPDDELSALAGRVDVFHVEPLQVPALDAERCLVWMKAKTA